MRTRSCRRVGLVLVGALGIAGSVVALGPVGASAAEPDPTPAEVGAISSFYAAKEFGGGATPSSPRSDTGAGQTASSIGSAYFNDFRADYASDPSIKVLSMDVSQTVLARAATSTGSRFTVSVTVSFLLTDLTDGSSFTGGETMDHVVTTLEPKGAPITVLSDQNTGASTAPDQAVAASAADVAAVSKQNKPLPAWQLAYKQTSAAKQAQQKPAAAAKKKNAYPALNFQAVAKYASLWTDKDHEGKLNSKYGDAGDNCTNFISQALHEGGWPIRDTTYNNRKNLDYWDYNMTGPGKFTYSWSRAEESYRMIHDKANKLTFGDLEAAGLADVVYFDWNVGGATYGDGVKDHAMIVTKRTKAHPYFSQKSGNRHNVSPKTVVKNIKSGGGTKWKVFGLHT